MTIIVPTPLPKVFIASVKDAIDAGDVRDWCYDANGDFAMVNCEGAGEAWFRPMLQETAVLFGLIRKRPTEMNNALYARYHAAFAEMLLCNFAGSFVALQLTGPLAANGFNTNAGWRDQSERSRQSASAEKR